QFGIHELAPVADMARSVNQLLESIAAPPTPQDSAGQNSTALTMISARASALARLVLPEDVTRLLRRRVVLVPSGPLQFVRFEVLPVSPRTDTGKILLDDHEVVRLPSASVIRGLRRADWQAQPRKALALFADPVLQPNDARVQRTVAMTEPVSEPRH